MNMSLFGVLGFFRGRQAGIIIKKTPQRHCQCVLNDCWASALSEQSSYGYGYGYGHYGRYGKYGKYGKYGAYGAYGAQKENS